MSAVVLGTQLPQPAQPPKPVPATWLGTSPVRHAVSWGAVADSTGLDVSGHWGVLVIGQDGCAVGCKRLARYCMYRMN